MKPHRVNVLIAINLVIALRHYAPELLVVQ